MRAAAGAKLRLTHVTGALSCVAQGRIEKTTLGEVVDAIEEVFDKQSCYLAIYLDEDTIQKLLLNVTAER